MAEAHLDHPGEVSWFAGKGPRKAVGPCPHTDCPHEKISTIAWGPDFDHYVLTECKDLCGGDCRQWFGEWPSGRYKEGPWQLVRSPE